MATKEVALPAGPGVRSHGPRNLLVVSVDCVRQEHRIRQEHRDAELRHM